MSRTTSNTSTSAMPYASSMRDRVKPRASINAPIEARGTMAYTALLMGSSVGFFAVMCHALFVLKHQFWLAWVIWGVALLSCVLAAIESRVMRVAVTGTHMTVQRLWSRRQISLNEVRSIRIVKGEYVVQTHEGSTIWIPSTLTHKAEVIARLQHAIAANVLAETVAANSLRVREQDPAITQP